MADINTKEVIDELYKKIDDRIKNLGDSLKDSLLPEAEHTLKKNIFTSIAVSFGVGFFLGILIAFLGKSKK